MSSTSLPLLAFIGVTQRLELSLVPSSDSKQVLHPNLLHLTHMKQRRVIYKSKLESASEWRLVLLIKENKKIFHVPSESDGEDDWEQEVGTLGPNNEVVLGKHPHKAKA